MDNLHIEIQPSELHYKGEQNSNVTCVIKRKVLNTGHVLEKHECKPPAAIINGVARIGDGARFNMSKQFEQKNTIIQVSYIAKKSRSINYLGYVNLDLAKINPQKGVYQHRLINSSDVHARAFFNINMVQDQPPPIPSKEETLPMGSLHTESFQKQNIIIARRDNPSFPTAYEISRKNYKQPQTIRQDNPSHSRSNGSKGYGQRYSNLGPHLTNINKTCQQKSGNYNSKYSSHKKVVNSPSPRLKTPQPINFPKNNSKSDRINGSNGKGRQSPTMNYRKGKQSPVQTKHNWNARNTNSKFSKTMPLNSSKKQQIRAEDRESPEALKVRPYSPEPIAQHLIERETMKQSKQSSSLFQIKDSKYKEITQKLELIQNKIHQKSQECNTPQLESESHQGEFYQKGQYQQGQSQVNTFNQFSHQKSPPKQKLIEHTVRETERQKPILPHPLAFASPIATSNFTNSKQGELDKTLDIKNYSSLRVQNNNKPQAIQTLLEKSQVSSTNERIIGELQNQNKELMGQNEKLFSIINHLKEELKAKIELIHNKQQLIHNKDQEIRQLEIAQQDKQNIIEKFDRLDDQRDAAQKNLKEHFQKEQQSLQETISMLERQLQQKNNNSINNNNINNTNEVKQESKTSYKEEFLKLKKELIQMQTQLKMKTHESSMMQIEYKNLSQLYKDVQQENIILTSNNKSELSRQRSIKHIVGNDPRKASDKMEIDHLKNQVVQLERKVEEYNRLLQVAIEKGELAGSRREVKWRTEESSLEGQKQLAAILERRVAELEKELDQKKFMVGEMINIIWSYSNPNLMQEIDNFITNFH